MVQTVRRAQTVVAGEVSVRASAVRSVSGGEVDIKASVVQQVQGDDIELEDAAVALAQGGHIELHNVKALAIAGRTVEAENVRTAVLLSPRINGTVHTLVDWKSAVAVGAGIVLMHRLLKLLRLGQH
ncbi:MAG: hypothetical protein HYX51_11655 [Chloroflexi bacterium]|nr:hypothetical protein [Chloroflexota bacterium]